jgi:hypothetical protein
MADEAKKAAGNAHSLSKKHTKKNKQRTGKIRRKQGKREINEQQEKRG